MFEQATDLSAYTVLATDGTVTISQQSGVGVGNPASGGLDYLSTGASDRSVVIHKVASSTPGAITQWTQSILINFKDLDDIQTGERKIESRLGFSATVASGGNLKEFLHKTNKGINVKVKAEQKVSDNKVRNLEIEASNFATSESKFGKVTFNNSGYFDDWLRITLRLTRTDTTTFDATLTLESLGMDGTQVPIQIHTVTQAGLSNSFLGEASVAHAVFLLNSDKAANLRAYVDDHSLTMTAIAPQPPVALTASNVTSDALMANWQTSNGAGSYRVEMTTAANNFAPGTFLSATGSGGQAEGFVVNGGSVSSVVVTGLSPQSTYVYRVRAINGAGASDPSNTISASTLALNTNVPPTLDALSNYPVLTPTAPEQLITLSGISAGFGETQDIVVTALSSNPSIIPHPGVFYTSPNTVGTLALKPAGGQGVATITVTVNDGQSNNNLFSRSFTVEVRQPPVQLGFEVPADLDELVISSLNGALTQAVSVGTGNPASGGAVFQGNASGSDQGILALRDQAYPGPAPTLMRQSIWVNFREVDDDPLRKSKSEIRMGFADSASVPSELKKFFEEGKHALHLKLMAENDPNDSSKDHVLKARVTSYNGSQKSESPELVVSDEVVMNHWLKATFDVMAVGTVQFQMSYKIEDYGVDGTTLLGTVLQGEPVNVVNGSLLAAPWIYAGFYVDTEKGTATRTFLDDHRVEVQNLPPETPVALPAYQVTEASFTSQWEVPVGPYPNRFVVEVVRSTDDFVAGKFIASNGTGGQASGIHVLFADQRSLRIFNLPTSSSYKYRVRAGNVAGLSLQSNAVTVTTLSAGSNAAPTLNAIPDQERLAANGGEFSIRLSGISDGGEFSQEVTVTATSDNPALTTDLRVEYYDPEDIGTLLFTPGLGQTGTAHITVTADDGQGVQNTTVRTFVVTVVDPVQEIQFETAGDTDEYIIVSSQSFLTRVVDEGTGTPAGGAFKFQRTVLPTEHVSLAYRRVRFDARSMPHASTSLMLNLREAVNVGSGKDKAEISLGFIGSTVPNTNLKDTFNKTHPAMFAKLKFENGDGKDRKLEVEVGSYNGLNDSNSGKNSLEGFSSADHWLKLTYHIVRAGFDQYLCAYDLFDCGLDGNSAPVLLMSSNVQVFTNAAFFNDSSIYAGFQINGEKQQSTAFWMDNHQVEVNTTAADAPLNQAANNYTASGFTLMWVGGLLGREPTGYVVELCRKVDAFAPGTLISAAGIGGQSLGFVVTDPGATDYAISGLPAGQSYLYRVRAMRGAELSAVQPPVEATVAPQIPAQTLAEWRAQWFDGELANPDTEPGADYDKDGVPNITEYALGLNPRQPDAWLSQPRCIRQGGYLCLTYRRRANMTEVQVVPQACDEPTGWTSEGLSVLSVSEADLDGLETVIIRDVEPIAANSRRFMRLSLAY